MMSRFKLPHALAAALLLFVPAVARAESRPDSWITMKAKTALYATDGVSGSDISVDTINGRVTLHGKVQSETEKALAEKEVRSLVGVVDVRNLLQVVSSTSAARVQRSDDVIKSEIESRIKTDRSLDDSSIVVKSVNKGVVLMGGKAESASDNLRALHTAAIQPGVVHVASEIETPDTFADDEFQFDRDAKTDSTHRTNGGVMSDLWITSTIKMRLSADNRTPATEINVDTYDGVVTLFGMVPSKESSAAAHEIAHAVSGVKSVQNQLEVVSSANKNSVQARDEDVRTGVKQALKDSGDQQNANINVEVSNGVVRLTGTVTTWQNNLSAVYAARSVTGVRSIHNELKVVTLDAHKT
jgi:hyperosmotically inducible protein